MTTTYVNTWGRPLGQVVQLMERDNAINFAQIRRLNLGISDNVGGEVEEIIVGLSERYNVPLEMARRAFSITLHNTAIPSTDW